MGRVSTNQVALAYSVEASLGVLEGSPTWKLLEPNGLPRLGATIAKVSRDPISPDRQRKKGTTSDLDSAVEIEHDLTKEAFKDFVEGFTMASARYPYADDAGTSRQGPVQSGSSFQDLLAVDTGNSFDHDALSAAIDQYHLVYTRGFITAANNGLHEVAAASTTISTKIAGSALEDETPGNTDNATMTIAGHRYLSADSVTWTFSTKTLARTGGLAFDKLGLSPGQVIHLGGLVSGRQFSAGVGYARIVSIAASAIVCDKVTGDLATADGAATDVDILFGAFIRNVATSDSDFLERSYQFELTLPDLDDTPADEYQYAKGNYANRLVIDLPLTDKATCTFGFVGTDTTSPSTSRESGAATPVDPVETVAFNTTADIVRLRVQQVDETGLTTCFKRLSLTLDNAANPEKCLGTLGATYMNIGNFNVNLEGQILLTNGDVIAAIRDNETVTMDFILKNDDGAICIDIPSMTLGDGAKELPINESVLLNTSAEAFKDATLDFSIGFSLIPTVP